MASRQSARMRGSATLAILKKVQPNSGQRDKMSAKKRGVTRTAQFGVRYFSLSSYTLCKQQNKVTVHTEEEDFAAGRTHVVDLAQFGVHEVHPALRLHVRHVVRRLRDDAQHLLPVSTQRLSRQHTRPTRNNSPSEEMNLQNHNLSFVSFD